MATTHAPLERPWRQLDLALMITTWRLWQYFLMQRTPHPLFIRLAPRAVSYDPENAGFFRTMTILLPVFLVASVLLPALNELFAILSMLVALPVFIAVLLATLLFPFVVVGGAIFGFRFATYVASVIGSAQMSGVYDLLTVTPWSTIGTIRAASAATLRRPGLFLGMGIYTATGAHLLLSFAISLVTITLFAISGMISRDSFTLSPILTLIEFLFVLGMIIWVTVVLHVDFRQQMMIGVTSGVFAGLTTPDRAELAATLTFMLLMIAGYALTVAVGVIVYGFARPLEQVSVLSVLFVTPAVVTYALRELAVHSLWRIILRRMGPEAFHIFEEADQTDIGTRHPGK